MASIPISGIEWTSLAQYLVWIERALDLKAINTNSVWSMRVSSSVKKLWSRKLRLKDVIVANEANVMVYMADKNPLEIELAVCNSLLANYKYYCDILDEQLQVLERLMLWEQANIEYVDLEVEEDVIPF